MTAFLRHRHSRTVHRAGCLSTLRRSNFEEWGAVEGILGSQGEGLGDAEIEALVELALRDRSRFCQKCLVVLESARLRIWGQARGAAKLGVTP